MAGSRREWDAEHDGRLAAEVSFVYVKGIAEFRHEEPWSAIPQLEELSRYLYPDARQSARYMEALNTLINDGIDQLEFERERQAAREGFGVQGSESFDKKRSVRLPAAADAAGVEPSTYRTKPKHERSTIVRVGRALELLAQRGPRDESAADSDWEDGYVRRIRLETELRNATKRPGVVLLYGDAGTGKTTLAQQHIRKVPRIVRVALRAHNESRLILDVRLELARLGFSTEELSDSAAKVKFRETLEAGSTAPIYVLLDNVDDEGVIDSLIPPQCHSRILITSRRKLNLVGLIGEMLHVGAMSTDEATQLAMRSAPVLNDVNAAMLAHSLCGHPLGIKAACGLLDAREDSSVAEIVKSVARNPSLVMATSASDTEANLLAIYEQVLQRFERSQSYEPAIGILEAIACVATVDIPRSLLSGYLAHKRGDADTALYRAICDRALNLLGEFSLIEQDDGINIHPLSQAVWRAIFRDRVRDVCVTLDMLMRQFALREVAELCLAPVDPGKDEEGQLRANGEAQSQIELFWDSHHFALITAAKGHIAPEELDFFGGCGSRAGGLIKLEMFSGLAAPSMKAVFAHRMQAEYAGELEYFGMTEETLARLLSSKLR